jgi:hypothetical protein
LPRPTGERARKEGFATAHTATILILERHPLLVSFWDGYNAANVRMIEVNCPAVANGDRRASPLCRPPLESGTRGYLGCHFPCRFETRQELRTGDSNGPRVNKKYQGDLEARVALNGMRITKSHWHWGGRPKKSANNDIIGQNGPQKNANLVRFKEKHTQTNSQETKKSLNNRRWIWPLNFSNYLALGANRDPQGGAR